MGIWQLVSTIASILGFIAAIVVAIWQHRVAIAAEKKADEERGKRASLEDHLERQRWQQLRSLGQQIDALEADGRKEYQPSLASLHASLKEQYSSLLSIIATSTSQFDATALRFWVGTGRLRRPWQIAEAVSHLNRKPSTSSGGEDERWLNELIEAKRVVPAPQPVKKALVPTKYISAYILMAYAVKDQLSGLLRRGGQSEYSISILLSLLAEDCLNLAEQGAGQDPRLRAWGYGEAKSFEERFLYYQKQEFWIVVAASDAAQSKLDGFQSFFNLTSRFDPCLLPKDEAVEQARARYPNIAEVSLTLLSRPFGIKND